jgi:hypothetical protein
VKKRAQPHVASGFVAKSQIERNCGVEPLVHAYAFESPRQRGAQVRILHAERRLRRRRLSRLSESDIHTDHDEQNDVAHALMRAASRLISTLAIAVECWGAETSLGAARTSACATDGIHREPPAATPNPLSVGTLTPLCSGADFRAGNPRRASSSIARSIGTRTTPFDLSTHP